MPFTTDNRDEFEEKKTSSLTDLSMILVIAVVGRAVVELEQLAQRWKRTSNYSKTALNVRGDVDDSKVICVVPS